MAKKADELLTYKTENFMKAYPLGTGAKEYVKEEFKRITTHMRNHQKSVNSELARSLKDKEEKETRAIDLYIKAVLSLQPCNQNSNKKTFICRTISQCQKLCTEGFWHLYK